MREWDIRREKILGQEVVHNSKQQKQFHILILPCVYIFFIKKKNSKSGILKIS